MSERIIILGSGGHAASLLDAITASEEWDVLGALDPDPAKHGQAWHDTTILGDDQQLTTLKFHAVAIGVGGTGDNRPRMTIYEQLKKLKINVPMIVHPFAMVSGFAELKDGSQILAGAIVNAGAEIGENTIINSGAIIEHDCKIGDHVHIATGAVLAGNVTVENLAHIGASAVIRQGIRVGEAAIVGAGAVVVKDVPAGTTVVGVPAKAMG